MTDAERARLLREALAPFVHAWEDAVQNHKRLEVAHAFFRQATQVWRATEADEEGRCP